MIDPMPILLVEDDNYKERSISLAITSVLPRVRLCHARSVHSCIKHLKSGGPFGLVILDMSLPTYDVSSTESGGRPQGFGGQNILQYMDAEEINYPVVIVTQFERFSAGNDELDFESLSEKLLGDFPEIFNGMIFYSANSEQWRHELTKVINNVYPRKSIDE